MDDFYFPRWNPLVYAHSTVLERLRDAISRTVYVVDPDPDDARIQAREIHRRAMQTTWCSAGYVEFDAPIEDDSLPRKDGGAYVIAGYGTKLLDEAIKMVAAGWVWDAINGRSSELGTTNHWLGVLYDQTITPDIVASIKALPSPTFDYLKQALVFSRLCTIDATSRGYVTDPKSLRSAYPLLLHPSDVPTS